MFCYNCGCQLSEHDFCTACGADVALYKKIMFASNRFYNEGLEKAGVRDLTGALGSLRQSLKFNKYNIEARNLLGLVYFEMGEVVTALSQWVISKNLRPEKNIADDYIDMIQANASRLESINQTIKKYNQAYAYCKQDSKDLAVIQLKKVLSLNPKFIQAHQLLALLYMESEQWDRAKRELKKCLDIDRNNTLALRYMKEVEFLTAPDESVKAPGAVKRRREESLRYQSDNEIIIQPLDIKERKGSGISTLVNMGIGLVIGLAAMYFLVVPSRVATVRSKMNQDIVALGEQLDAKTVDIQGLEAQVAGLQEERDDLNKELEGYVGTGGTLSTMDNLLTAASVYLETQDPKQTAEDLEGIAETVVIEETSEAFQTLYHTLFGVIGPPLSQAYYTEGMQAYNSRNYEEAIEALSKAALYDESNVEAWYNLGNAYRGAEDTQNAVATYNKLIELFPDTDRARRAQRAIDDMAGAVR